MAGIVQIRDVDPRQKKQSKMSVMDTQGLVVVSQ